MSKKRARQQFQSGLSWVSPAQSGGAAFAAAASRAAPHRKSTLPAIFTDLLNVEPTPDTALIPPHARAGKWEDHHEFHRSATKPSRTSYGVHCPDPPLALICPECSARQPAITGSSYTIFGDSRRSRCSYCGLTMTLHGSRLMWWR